MSNYYLLKKLKKKKYLFKSFVDMACVCFGYTTVPFYDTLGFDTISYILK